MRLRENEEGWEGSQERRLFLSRRGKNVFQEGKNSVVIHYLEVKKMRTQKPLWHLEIRKPLVTLVKAIYVE